MTPRQLEVLDLYREFADVGVSPTIREVARRLRLGSVSSVHATIERLVQHGALRRTAGKNRGVELANRPDLRLASSDALRAELARRGETLEALRVPQQRAYGRRQSCAADTCGIAVQRGHLFCLTHWRALPRELQNDIFAAFRARDTDRYQQLVAEARDIADGCCGALS